jgi:hypothetical protein
MGLLDFQVRICMSSRQSCPCAELKNAWHHTSTPQYILMNLCFITRTSLPLFLRVIQIPEPAFMSKSRFIFLCSGSLFRVCYYSTFSAKDMRNYNQINDCIINKIWTSMGVIWILVFWRYYCLIHPHINNHSPVHSRPGMHYGTAYSLTGHLLYILYLFNMYIYC